MKESMIEYVQQGWTVDGQLPLLVGIAALLGLGKGGVPGLSTVATAATVSTAPTSIVGGLAYAVALQVPILTMIDVAAAWLHFKDLDVGTIKLLLPTSFCGMAVGMWLSEILTDNQARFLVGMFLLLILAVQLAMGKLGPKDQKHLHTEADDGGDGQEHNVNDTYEHNDDLALAEKGGMMRKRSQALSTTKIDKTIGNNTSRITTSEVTMNGDKSKIKDHHGRHEIDKNTKIIWACVVGIIGGAATMLTNAMGPILNVYLLSVIKLSPTAYIGTRAAFFCFLNVGKLPMRFYNGTLGWPMVPLAGFLGLVSVVGVMGAKPIMLSLSEKNFVRFELAVVAFSGVRLIWMGLNG